MSSQEQASSSQVSPPQPPPGYIHLLLLRQECPFYLEIPIQIVTTLCLAPRKYLQYLGWCILGAKGHLENGQGRISLNGNLDDQHIYYYIVPGQDILAHAIDLEVIKQRTQIPSKTTNTRNNFRTRVLERDGRCVWTGTSSGVGMHIIPYARGDEWLQRIVENRPHNESLDSLSINDIRNGVYAIDNLRNHYFDPRQVVILKTPNPMLLTTDVPPRSQRILPIPTGLNYPRGSRYTLQWIVTKDNQFDMMIFPNNNDATFMNQQLVKPADLLLHYNYGAAAVKQWGKNVLTKRHVIPRPPVPTPASTGPSKTIHDRTVAIRKREDAASGSRRRRTGEAVGDLEQEQEKWDEDDVMLFFWGNSKVALERHAQKKEECTVELENWRAGVTGNPDI